MSSDKRLLDKLFVKVCEQLKGYDKQLNENFHNLPTNFDRFKFIWCIGILHKEFDALLENEYYDTKDTQKSNEYRQQGIYFKITFESYSFLK